MNTTEGIAGFAYVFGSILFTVYGQIIVKWQVGKAGALPVSFSERIPFFLSLIFNPWILSGMLAGFCALVCWLAAMTKFDLSYAYPFMSLAFVLVLILSALLFHEPLTTAKILGVLLIIAGIIVGSRG
ncbi:MAG TPA: EamA family transporter [Pyrinomonadaceae bacterium]|nr:EamA family transporter [Pyrinomonadaceae bacterium]